MDDSDDSDCGGIGGKRRKVEQTVDYLEWQNAQNKKFDGLDEGDDEESDQEEDQTIEDPPQSEEESEDDLEFEEFNDYEEQSEGPGTSFTIDQKPINGRTAPLPKENAIDKAKQKEEFLKLFNMKPSSLLNYYFNSDDEDSQEDMEMGEIKNLMSECAKLQGDRLNQVAEIVHRRENVGFTKPDEIAIDFESLEPVTLRELEAYMEVVKQTAFGII